MAGLMTVFLTGCQQEDVTTDKPSPSPEPVKDYVLADLALSLPATSASAGTRLSAEVTQETDGFFRGISHLSIVPFYKRGTIELTDLPTYYEPANLETTFTPLGTKEQYRRYEKFTVKHGVASFLTYGRAAKNPTLPTGISAKAYYGSLLATVEDNTTEGIPNVALSPATLSFSLDPIFSGDVETEAMEKAKAIADYLTYIAQTPGWENAASAALKTLYQGFVNETISSDAGNEYGVLAGSSKNVVAYVNDLYQKMNEKKSSSDYISSASFKNVVDGVMDRIKGSGFTSDKLTLTKSGENVTSLGDCDNYPAAYGLPDGAAVLMWAKKADNTYGFVPQTETTTVAPISGIKRYGYPAELYYYGNSTIRTSLEDPSYTEKTSWADVLNLFTAGSVVSSSTVALAIEKSMQYAVARLKATVQAGKSNLTDSDGKSVTVGSTTFPITGLIVSGQHPVGFDFKPETADDGDDHERFVYDRYLSSVGELYLTTEVSSPFQTMLLQTKEKENITLILEVENKSGQDFKGEGGLIVFKDTKFYLVGKIQPASGSAPDGADDAETADLRKRVFTQDHTTEMTMTVQTLKHAYNVMPNIQSGRLEVSVQIQLNWNGTKPYSFQFEE